MADGDIEEFLGLFAITFIKIAVWSLLRYFLLFLMVSLDKFILLNGYPFYSMHFGPVGLVWLITLWIK